MDTMAADIRRSYAPISATAVALEEQASSVASTSRALGTNLTSRGSSRYVPMASRKQSVSSTRQPRPSSTRSRSSSKHSGRKRSDEHRPRRIHTSPAAHLSGTSIDDAIAFHERSCQLMESLTNTKPRSVSHDSNYYAVRPAASPTNRSRAQSYLSSRHLVPPQPTSIASSTTATSSDHEDDGRDEKTHEPDCPAESVTNWTSDATRRRQYADIDRRNGRLRRLLRKLVPACAGSSKERGVGFYDDDKEESDAGSVRRYRLDLPAEGK